MAMVTAGLQRGMSPPPRSGGGGARAVAPGARAAFPATPFKTR
jgi:hypothetical protein